MQEDNRYQVYTPEDIRRYVTGAMNAQEMHLMEKAALNDPLLADAIDGFKNADAAKTTRHLEEIKTGILGFEQKEPVIVPIPQKAHNPAWYWLAAATVTGLMITGSWWLTQNERKSLKGISRYSVKNDTPVAVNAAETTEQFDSLAHKNGVAPSLKTKVNLQTEILPGTRTAKKDTAIQLPENNNPVAALVTIPAENNKPLPVDPVQANVMSAASESQKTTGLTQPNTSFIRESKNNQAEMLHKDHVNIPANNADDMVVVAGYSKPRKAATGNFRNQKADTSAMRSAPYPEDGWTAFYENLAHQLGVDKSRATRTLHIQFTIDDNGDPANFTIFESPDEMVAKKAIEIIKKGGKWKNFRPNKNAAVKIQVN